LTEDAVGAAGIEAEATERALEYRDIVAAHHGHSQRELAVAEPVAGLDEGRPSRLVADAINPQATRLLKALEGIGGGGSVVAVLVPAVVTRSVKAALKIADGFALRAKAEIGAVYRNSPSSWSS
jgi:hypothetical protein